MHTRGAVAAMQPRWQRVGIRLRYLPAYSPELSAIEPLWNTIKQQELPTRSFTVLCDLKRAASTAFEEKAATLR